LFGLLVNVNVSHCLIKTHWAYTYSVLQFMPCR